MIAEVAALAPSSPSQTLVLYDGVCGLCNRMVKFLLRHDRQDQFCFAPLQSELAKGLLRQYRLDAADFDSVVAIANFRQPNERALTRSGAAIWSVRQLGGIWQLFSLAALVPGPLRDGTYRWIARHRYRIFGKFPTCPLPDPKDREKFLS